MRDLCSCIDDWAYLATMEKQIEAWKELRRLDGLMRRLGNRYPIVRAFSRLESKISCSLDGYDASLEDVLSYPERYIIERRRILLFEPSLVLNPKSPAVSMGTMLHLKMFFPIQSATSSSVVEAWGLNVRY